MRLLVVDDDVRLLHALTLCLQRAGFDVATARNAPEAIVQVAECIPDLVVTDVIMPGIDGFGLTEHLRSNARTDLIPIVFLTARDTLDDRVRGFRGGVDAFVSKPFEPDELIAIIQGILQRVKRTHTRFARAAIAGPTSLRESSPEWPGDLTPAERRVSSCVARGLSNKQIASELNVSRRTVEMHISRVLSKTGWSNRVDIARHVLERGLSK
jgi:DNA-binding NarL/FixJ family response regulator